MASKMAAFGPVWPIQSLQFAGALWTHARDTGSPGTLTSSGVQARKTITVSTFESGNHSSCFFAWQALGCSRSNTPNSFRLCTPGLLSLVGALAASWGRYSSCERQGIWKPVARSNLEDAANPTLKFES